MCNFYFQHLLHARYGFLMDARNKYLATCADNPQTLLFIFHSTEYLWTRIFVFLSRPIPGTSFTDKICELPANARLDNCLSVN